MDAIDKLKEMVELSGSQKAVAEELGISPAYLNDILKRGRGISDRIAFKLGYEWKLVPIEEPK
jgi:plasmid maintenance system antidote protein VapI